MKVKTREDLHEFVLMTDDGFELNKNEEYKFRWVNEDHFQVLINEDWRDADSIDFDFIQSI
jgi:hypothetical protein